MKRVTGSRSLHLTDFRGVRLGACVRNSRDSVKWAIMRNAHGSAGFSEKLLTFGHIQYLTGGL